MRIQIRWKRRRRRRRRRAERNWSKYQKLAHVAFGFIISNILYSWTMIMKQQFDMKWREDGEAVKIKNLKKAKKQIWQRQSQNLVHGFLMIFIDPWLQFLLQSIIPLDYTWLVLLLVFIVHVCIYACLSITLANSSCCLDTAIYKFIGWSLLPLWFVLILCQQCVYTQQWMHNNEYTYMYTYMYTNQTVTAMLLI